MLVFALSLLMPLQTFSAGTEEGFLKHAAAVRAIPMAGPDVPRSQEGVPIILVDNFGVVADGIYRGRRLQDEKDYQLLSGTLGVETLVNLRWAHADDAELCAEHHLKCVRYPIRLVLNDSHFDWKMLKDAFHFVNAERRAGRKVYIHCDHGSDRTGALAAALTIRLKACGQAFDEDELWESVDKTMREHGFHKNYRKIHATVKSWVYGFSKNPWLCQ